MPLMVVPPNCSSKSKMRSQIHPCESQIVPYPELDLQHDTVDGNPSMSLRIEGLGMQKQLKGCVVGIPDMCLQSPADRSNQRVALSTKWLVVNPTAKAVSG